MAETIDTYGIDETIEGYTVESANVKKIPVQEQIHGQHNEVRKEIKYDLRKDLSCTLRGAVEPTAATFDGFGGAGRNGSSIPLTRLALTTASSAGMFPPTTLSTATR